MILLIKIYKIKKYKMNNFNCINTLKHKRNEQFSNKKTQKNKWSAALIAL